MVDLPVRQTGDGADAGGVTVAVVAVGLGNSLVAARPTNRMLDPDPAAGERLIVRHVFVRPGLAARLAARRGPNPCGCKGAMPT